MKKKAVLLSGPPGIGKTTSALIIARELGFEPVEVCGGSILHFWGGGWGERGGVFWGRAPVMQVGGWGGGGERGVLLCVAGRPT